METRCYGTLSIKHLLKVSRDLLLLGRPGLYGQPALEPAPGWPPSTYSLVESRIEKGTHSERKNPTILPGAACHPRIVF